MKDFSKYCPTSYQLNDEQKNTMSLLINSYNDGTINNNDIIF